MSDLLIAGVDQQRCDHRRIIGGIEWRCVREQHEEEMRYSESDCYALDPRIPERDRHVMVVHRKNHRA